MRSRKAQTIIEFTVLMIIIMAVFLAMQFYVKRGIQGRWKATLDDLGDQYDPRFANSNILFTIESNSSTQILTKHETGGFYTTRTDKSNSVTTTNGLVVVGDPF